ncbi:MAG: DUF4091 domain-containing protein, partial [Armatimonadota bacterium]
MREVMMKMIALVITMGLTCPLVVGQEVLIDSFEAPNPERWSTGGQKEISFGFDGEHTVEGEQALHIHVEIDHQDVEFVEGQSYPMGWPSVDGSYDPPIDLSQYDFLEFDVYFESADGEDPDFALNVTTYDDQEDTIYRATLIDLRHGQWAHEKLCIRDLERAKTFGGVHYWLSESTYDHGDVIDFWIDNLRATRAEDYQPPGPSPVRQVVAEAEFATLWMEGPARKVRRAEETALEGGADPVVRISAARNESEAVQLVVTPRRDEGLGEVSVEVGEITGPGGATIAAENVFWSEVYCVPAREGPPEGLPDALPGPKPFTLDGPGNWPIWLEVYVPPDTPPGDYRAPITVTTDRGDLRARLQLHVWDFDIPVKQSLRTSTTIYGYWGFSDQINEWFGNQDWNHFVDVFRPRMVELLARYRLCPSNLGHLPLDWDEERQRVVLGDTTEYEESLRHSLALGHHIDGMPVPYFFSRDAFLGAEKGTEEYLDRIEKAYRVAAEYLESQGWLEGSYVYPADEVVVHKNTRDDDLELLNRVFERIKAAHPKIQLFGAEVPSPVLHPLDIYCINMSAFDLDVLEEQHALGNDVWWYNGYRDPRPGTRIVARGVDHRALFWMNYRFGIDGYLIWTVNRWVTDPWEQPNRSESTPAGNHFLLYPNPDGTVSPSIRICMMRDGLEDYEYHVLLEAVAGQARDAGNRALAE